ncbi:MAG: hypothetical protein CVV41_09805 [Candidatus Riflebacteria bacterium HGW-Riflebacteria-1]|jgi:major vault protein|nr:MAG: hypothetical protein CVV41_09805 [Candidatus Riflebacteria bacterium HGW-Riflebacteria-1]
MPENTNRERDLVLAPNEYCLISDQTKGHIVVYVGPYKTSLANTDQPVLFNDQQKRFERTTLELAISVFSTAPEGWYLVLKNPPKDGIQPPHFGSNSLPELRVGHKVNIPGPVNFALWPGQMVRVVQGHYLHLNQYLVVRVYDEEAAKLNWKKAVVKPQQASTGEDGKPAGISDGIPDLTMGKQLVINGTEVSFYIPPTGVEVVRDSHGGYLREAVTLERLEYCILLDEDGNKRFIQGPAVVFPSPTETFIEKSGSRKFKAIELNEISGIYIKVIAPYSENGVEHKVGEELFITGKDQMIYFPRPEHAIIKYGEKELHYSVAIPAGEGRYVLNRMTGKISLVRGPAMFLADPRNEVIVRRFLELRQVSLMYPGNQEALEYNMRLKQIAKAGGNEDYLTDSELKRKLAVPRPPIATRVESGAPEGFAGDDFTRSPSFTQPRTITLDTKYEGAVALDIWTGYAVLVVGRTGERQVVTGPQTVLLEYDQALEAMELSTGTPKTDEKTIKTAYLRCLHNKVSDLVEAETSDLCRVKVRMSYRVNFEGEPEKWFNVENYVKFLTDHMRSLIRNAVKQHRIENFYANAITIVRDCVLGVASTDGKRPGRLFTENGMRIYDIEILDVKIGNEAIEQMLVAAQHSVVKQTLAITSEKRNLEYVQQSEAIKQEEATLRSTTKTQDLDLQTVETKSALLLNLAKIDAEIESQKKALTSKLADQETLNQIDASELGRKRELATLELEMAEKRLNLRIEELKAEVAGVVDRANAVSPDFIAALQAFGDKALAEKLAESMAPLAILGGKSIAEVFAQLVKGTTLEDILKKKAELTKK